MSYFNFSKETACQLLGEREARHRAFCEQKCTIDLSRGRPSKEQLVLSEPMLQSLETTAPDGTDCRTYGAAQGIYDMRALWGSFLDVPPNRVVLAGSSSLAALYDALVRALLFGTDKNSTPWIEDKARALLCPVPGYDRHFRIGETLGFRLIPVPMTDEGPDMDVVEALVRDAHIKGIFCVPKYANPTGVTYSQRTVERLANMTTAASDFLILWDNAYFCHDLYDAGERLANIFTFCERAGHPSRPLMFASTSKITFPGSGIAALVAGEDYLAYNLPLLAARAICPDQISALRHQQFLQDAQTLKRRMQTHAAILRPRFEMVLARLEEAFGDSTLVEWSRPRGGYFITLRLPCASAKRVYHLAREAGVSLTPAGATHPYGVDPEDAYLRIAPTSLTLEELALACDVLINAIWISILEAFLAEK